MTIEARAMAILKDAESKLRQLTAEAASAGEYSAIIKVAAWARTVSDLTSSQTPENRRVPAESLRHSARKDAKTQSTSRVSPPQSKEYPRFYRRGEELVRAAWSKREKTEYLHKAPHSTLKALAAVFAEAGKGGRVFSTDEILPIQEPRDNGQVPNYQAYVGIAWLKHTGLIEQHGRQGYSVPRLSAFENEIESLWRSLPTQ